MKRLLNFALSLIMVSSLAACNNQVVESPKPTPATAELTATVEIDDNSTFAVHYIDIGQGDATLVVCDGASLLIDGGKPEKSNTIVAYLRKLNIDSLDYMVCTHADEDHVGGLSGALSVMSVKNIFAPNTEKDTKAYQNFKNKAAAQNTEIQHPVCGNTFELGSSTAQFVGPVSENTSEVNNTSLVLKIAYGNTKFLFTGDAEREEEQDIINAGYDIGADVLKVGHHGSRNSTSYLWLREIMPQYAVISVGKDNSYGHPTEEVLSRLRDAGVKLYRTDLQGDIIATSDRNTVSITASRNENIQTNETVAEKEAPEAEYIGNKNSKKFHRPTCSSLPSEQNRVYFFSREEAISALFSPCKNCNP